MRRLRSNCLKVKKIEKNFLVEVFYAEKIFFGNFNF